MMSIKLEVKPHFAHQPHRATSWSQGSSKNSSFPPHAQKRSGLTPSSSHGAMSRFPPTRPLSGSSATPSFSHPLRHPGITGPSQVSRITGNLAPPEADDAFDIHAANIESDTRDDLNSIGHASTAKLSNPVFAMESEPWKTAAHPQVSLSNFYADMLDFENIQPNESTDRTNINLFDTSAVGNLIPDNSTPFQDSCRLSSSSLSLSSGGPLADVPQDDELSSSMIGSERLSFISDSNHWNILVPHLDPCSPVASHRSSIQESLQGDVRSRASPKPHNNARSSPYSTDSGRDKRWSTGMYAPSLAPQRTVPSYTSHRHSCFYGSPLNPVNDLTGYGAIQATALPPLHYPAVSPAIYYLTTPGGTLISSPEHAFPSETAYQLPSQGRFPLLQSNVDHHSSYSSHFAGLAGPPELFSSLQNEPDNPPEEEMNPSDPDLMPREQGLRFTGDLYTPHWVRGHGNKREGWCGLCKPSRWLVLKNSAFWYDKSFTHGVSAATGVAFQGPQDTRRTAADLDVWEGLCGSCGEWIALVSNKKKGTTWFRHAYKCHTHQKAKDGSKRKRETGSSSRTRPASIARRDEPKVTEVHWPLLGPDGEVPLTSLKSVPSERDSAFSSMGNDDFADFKHESIYGSGS